MRIANGTQQWVAGKVQYTEWHHLRFSALKHNELANQAICWRTELNAHLILRSPRPAAFVGLALERAADEPAVEGPRSFVAAFSASQPPHALRYKLLAKYLVGDSVPKISATASGAEYLRPSCNFVLGLWLRTSFVGSFGEVACCRCLISSMTLTSTHLRSLPIDTVTSQGELMYECGHSQTEHVEALLRCHVRGRARASAITSKRNRVHNMITPALH